MLSASRSRSHYIDLNSHYVNCFLLEYIIFLITYLLTNDFFVCLETLQITKRYV